MRKICENAMLFDLVRGSFVDGPGIRTTVFFKGCNLRCAWCHNPESQSFEKQLMFYKNKCIGCGTCEKVCPHRLNTCDLCGQCEIYCPSNARKICGKETSADEVFAEVIKDKSLYESSNGGVTFSGGECMLQIDFLSEILKRCKENGIHTAVDTAGCVPFESFEKVLPYVDLFLYDIKTLDDETHKKYTGVSNALILDNLKKLSAQKANLWIRVPVIGGVNDSAEELRRIYEYVLPYHPAKTEFLPYHSLGEGKYAALGKSFPYDFKTKADTTVWNRT